MGISINTTVEGSWKHKRRCHRVLILNRVEDKIDRYKASSTQEEDVSLWLSGKDQYKRSFSSGETWQVIRERHQLCHWHNEVWFKYATPKYSFILWPAMKGILATGDRMRYWNGVVNVSCILCNDPMSVYIQHRFGRH